MKLMSIGKFVQKIDYKTNIQNYQTLKGMSLYFEEIHLIVQSPDSKYHAERIDNIYIYWMPNPGDFFSSISFMINSYKQGHKIIREHKIDILDVGEPIISGFPAVLLKRMAKTPLVVQVQGQLVNLPKEIYRWEKRLLCRMICLFICRRADRIRSVSNEIAQSLIELGIDGEKISVVTPRCDTDMFDRKNHISQRSGIRKSIGVYDNEMLLVFVGRLIPTKGVDSVIQAIKILLNDNRKVKLLIVGDGPYNEDLKKLARSLGIEKDVIFFGRIPYTDVPKYLTAGDIFVAPSHDEAVARSVLEGMSMQMPVIVTPVGANTEVITHKYNGIIVPVNDPDAIAKSVSELMDDSDFFLKLSNNSRAIVETEYEYKKQIEKFAEVYRSMEVQ